MKTSELTGAALDWAVALCVFITDNPASDFCLSPSYAESYSTDWCKGGPIIEKEWLHVEPWPNSSTEDRRWSCTQYELDTPVGCTGPTPLIAAMRCYVTSKLGDEIEIPEELK